MTNHRVLFAVRIASSSTNWCKAVWLLALGAFVLCPGIVRATDNYEYGKDEYVTIAKGLSPNKEYAITAHGAGEFGYGGFHIFLTNAATGKKIGPLEEIKEPLDTGAGSFGAQWSDDSQRVVIIYRISRQEPLQAISYHIAKGRAFRLKGPSSATGEQTAFWGKHCSNSEPSEKTFGTPKAQ